MSIIKKLTAGCLAVLMLAGGAVLPDGVLSDMDTAVVANAATTNPYSGENEVFYGKSTNTGYNINTKSFRFDDNKYDNVPVLDVMGTQIADYNKMYEAGVRHLLFYIGGTRENKNQCTFQYDNSPYIGDWVSKAQKAGIKVGLIYYGYPLNDDYVKKEANFICNTIKKYGLKVDLPIFYDVEASMPNVTTSAKMINKFYNYLSTYGYNGKVGIYCSANQGSCFDLHLLLKYKLNLCVWQAAYENTIRVFNDEVIYMHQYTGNSADWITSMRPDMPFVDGMTSKGVDISMAFPERPADYTGKIYTVGTNQNSIQCSSVSDVDGYRYIVTYKDGTKKVFDQMRTQDASNWFTAADDMKSITVKTLKVDKYGFIAESLKGVSTPASWHLTSISSCSVSIPKTSYIYTGSAIKPAVTVKYGSKTLKNGTDYTVSYKNNKAVGTATITVTGKGDYSGTKAKTFTIVSKAVSNVKVQYTTGYAYTGKAITPNVTVTGNDGKTLKKDTDYTVSYSNNINIGSSAKITVKGKGSYTGSKTITFTIKPKMPSYKAVQNSKGILFAWETPAEISALSASVKKNIGYEIMWSKNNDFSDAKTANLTSATATSYNTNLQGFLTSGTWYVKCRAYIKVGDNRYGNWSSKTVTIK